MTIRNIPTLADLCAEPAVAKNLDPETMIALYAEIAEVTKTAANAKKILNAFLQDKHAVGIAAAYTAADKMFGAVHVDLDGFDLEIDTEKKVDWDQAGLAKLEAEIRASDDDPAEYIKVERKVEEKKFTSWPAMLKKQFEVLRTTKTGSVSVKLTKVEPADLV